MTTASGAQVVPNTFSFNPKLWTESPPQSQWCKVGAVELSALAVRRTQTEHFGAPTLFPSELVRQMLLCFLATDRVKEFVADRHNDKSKAS